MKDKKNQLKKKARKLKAKKKIEEEFAKLVRHLSEIQPYPDESDDEYKIIGIGKCSYCGNNTFVKKGSTVFCPKCGSMPYEEKDNLSKKKIEKLTILTLKEKRKLAAKKAAETRKERYEKMTPEQKVELHLKLSASSKNSWKNSALLQQKMRPKTRKKYGIKK